MLGCPCKRELIALKVVNSSSGRNPFSASTAYKAGLACPLLNTKRSRSNVFKFSSLISISSKYNSVKMSVAPKLPPGCPLWALYTSFTIFLRIFFACNASSLFSIIFTLSPFCAYIITNFLSQYTPYKKSIISQTLILPHISCIIDQFYVILTNPNQFQRFKYVYPFFK